MSAKTKTLYKDWSDCLDDIDTVVNKYVDILKKMGKKINCVDVKAVVYKLLSESCGRDEDGYGFTESVIIYLENKWKYAKEIAEDRVCVEMLNRENGMYPCTKKLRAALKSKNVKKDEFMDDTFFDDFIVMTNKFLKDYIDETEHVTYTNIFKYMKNFSDYIADKINDDLFPLNEAF